MEPCGDSGLMFASNRGYPQTWNEIGKRLKHWYMSADDNEERAKSVESYQEDGSNGKELEHVDTFLERKHSWEKIVQTSAFTYIDQRYGAYLKPEDEQRYDTIYKVLERKHTNYLCDKKQFAVAAKAANVEGVAVPYSWFTKEEAVKAMAQMSQQDLEELGDVLFIKDFWGTLGSGIDVIEPSAILASNFQLEDGHLIQQGLTNGIYLHDGHKVTFRGFMIIMQGSLYVHKHAGWSCTQEELFDSKSSKKEVQISHHDIELKHLEKFPNYTKWTKGFAEMAKKAGPMFEMAVKQTAIDPTKFSFLGVDFIPFEDGSVQMLEVNSYPSFRRPDVMFEIILRLMDLIHLDPYLDERMQKVWTYDGHDGNEL